MTARPFRTLAIAAFVILAAACARPVQIGSDPGPVYALEVVNPLQEDMIVSYDAGGGDRTLGTVRAGDSERFLITAPPRLSVSIRARAPNGRTTGPFAVQLAAGTTASVTLR